MNQTEFKFDLFDIVRVSLKWKKQIILFTLACSLISGVYFMMQKNTYEAYGAFFPASAVMSGRINLFRETNQDWIDYFGGENEVDRATVVANSASVISYLIDSFKLAEHYKIDVVNDKNGAQKLYKKFSKNFKVSRSGYKHIEITFSDEDHDLAYRLTNAAILRIEEQLRELYIRINNQLALSLEIRHDSISQSLALISDSLANARVKYGIYDIIAPGRKNLLSFTPKSSGLEYAKGLELIQNLEEVKDKLAMDRAKYLSLANEFRTATFDGFPMLHVTQWASPYGPKSGPFRTLGVITVFLASLLFSIILACIIDIFKSQAHKLN